MNGIVKSFVHSSPERTEKKMNEKFRKETTRGNK
jgi:hypothetical protein